MKLFVAAGTLLLLSASVNAYERVTHSALSAEAARNSVLKKTDFLSQLGLQPKALDEPFYNLFPTSEGGAVRRYLSIIWADW